MAIPLLRAIGFTKGLREALPFFEGLVTSNPAASATSILRAARDAGLSFRDGPAFQLISQLKKNRDLLERFKISDPDDVPRVDQLGEDAAPLKRNYAYVASITGFNSATGEREVRHVTVVSDELLSINQIEQSVRDLPRDRPGSQTLSNTTFDLERAVRSPLATD